MQQNKITTKQTLQKLQENLADKDFRKEFGKLIVSYFNVDNPDTTAFYHKILKLLQDTGFSKEEAESFFKDLRVKENKTIIKISKIQREIDDLQREYKKARIKILINPLNVATLISLYYSLYQEIQQNIAKIKEGLMLKLKTNLYIDNKIKEIEEILNKNLQELKEMQDQQEDNKITKLNDIFNTTTKLEEKLQDLQENLVLQELDNTISGKEAQTQDQQQDQEQNNQEQHPSSPEQVHQQQTTLTEELEDCLKAVTDVTNTADKKTLAFLTISEYVHRGNEIEDKELFKHFSNILDRKEFNNIVNINKALLTGEIDYSKVKEVLDKQGFKGLIELGENVNREQKITDKEKEKNKELGLGQPSKVNLSMPSLN